MKTRLAFLLALAASSVTNAATDAYRQWAVSKWGVTIAGADNTRATTWGETADPDRDGIPNLLEYLADTNPTARTPLSDVYAYSVPDSGAPQFRYPQLLSWQRTDDPDVRILCQTSSDLHTWLPAAPADLNSPAPANPFLTTEDTGVVSRGLRQVRYRDLQSIAGRPGAFMRLLVVRRDQIATGPGIDPFTFTPGQSVATSSTARSSAITLGGFTGSLTLTIPSGVTLFVNGVAQTGPTATVKAGDVLWMEATAPGTNGVQCNYTLTIGTQSATWTFTTGTPAAVPDHPGTDSGYTPVETGVSDTGAAQISIPIVVSPGTGGMQPKLSINYSSQGGNGPLGIGFSLSGLSTISRVGRTVAQDGVKGGVNFDANDRFALDGQRLIAINGADGADGTEYRLEFDPTSRIRSYGTVGSGPQRWVVETKSGLKMEFGNTPDSRFLPDGSASAITWSVNKTADTVGNEMDFVYFTDGVFHQLQYIRYTANPSAGLSYQSEVFIRYENRPDDTTSYIAGKAITLSNRIDLIESRSKNSLGVMKRVRRYDLGYQQGVPSGRSQLTTITETATDGTAFPATMIEWQNNSAIATFQAAKNSGVKSYAATHVDDQAADFNGDGLTDLLIFNTIRQEFDLFLNQGNAAFGAAIETNITAWNANIGSFTRVVLGDFNADGKMDVVSHNNADNDYYLYFSTGTGFQAPVDQGISPYGDYTTPIVPGDFDGDGRTDLLIWQLVTALDPVAKYYLFRSTGTAFRRIDGARVPCGSDPNVVQQLPGDYNGDGKTDILIWHEPLLNNRYNLFISNGTGFDAPVATDIESWDNPLIPNIAGDFNGDGLTDVMVWYRPFLNNRYNLYTCTGNGFKAAVSTVVIPDDQTDVLRQTTNDFTGDGIMDMVVWENASQRYWLNAANGHGFDNRINTDIPSYTNPKATNLVGDFNGDGRSDVCVWYAPYNNSKYNIYLSQGAQPDLVSKVTNGHGGYTTFEYKALTDPAIYTKGGGTSYPCYELQASMHVVSALTSRNGVDSFTFGGGAVIGLNSVTYTYEGAWTCLDGRGFMGFRAVEATDATTGIISRTEYESSSPLLAGRVNHTDQQLIAAPPGGSKLISKTDVIWSIVETAHPTGSKTYFVHEGRSGQSSYEVNNPDSTALIRSVSHRGPGAGGTMTYDGYGNLLESVTATTAAGETFKDTVSNTYTDTISLTKWHLGRLATSTVTKTGPNPVGGADINLTRSSSFAYHSTTGLLTQEVIEPGGGILRQQKDYAHDAFGNILTSTLTVSNEAPRTTTTTYTADGRFVATTTNAEGHTESKTYDPLLGNVLTQTGPNGLTTTWEYDSIGRPIKETRPDGTVTRSFFRRVTFDTIGKKPQAVHYVRVQSSGGSPKTVWYDLLDREVATDGIAFDGRTVCTDKQFNARGEVVQASQPYFAGDTPLYSTMLYDAVGREYQQTDPGNRVTKTTYDGLTTTVERNYNPAALTQFQKAVTVVNAMGWTVQSSQYLGATAKTVTRSYDPYGNLRFVTDPAGNTTELRYDKRGNKTWMSEPNSGAATFTYNGFGELKTQTNAASQTTTLAYDRLGRVTSRTEPEGVTTFTYDTAAKGIGQLAREAGPGMERRYFYDALARPVATAETHGFHTFSTSRGYDLYSRPESVTYPSGFATRQVYNAQGHLSEVQNGTNSATLYWRALQVNARGQVTREALGNGIVTDRAFEAESGIIQGITSTLGASGDVQNLGFTFDLIGNLTERRDKRFSTHFIEGFGYDTLNRLTNLTTTGAAAVTAGYDDLGNLKSRSDVGTFNYAASGPHALSSVTGSSGGALNKTCGYDAKGNRTSDGGTVLDYSSFNKPTRIRKGGDTLSFDYGPDRALYRQTIFSTSGTGASSQTVREYIGGLYEREITSEGLVRHIHHIAGGNGVVAIHTDERSATSAAQRTRFIHKDHLGSVDAITDSNGVVVERQSYDAWGRRRTVTHNAGTWTVTYPAAPGSAETHRGFTGHEMLDLVGLVHMGGRIYDPITARFLSPDPFVQSPDNLQNLNRYSYVLNNPLSYTDPSGFFFKGIGKWIGKHWKQIATVAIGIAIAVVVPGSWSVLAQGFASGFGSAFSGTLLAGGSVGDALRAGLVGGAWGALSAGVADRVGSVFAKDGSFAELARFKPIVHGVSQGAIRQAQGGKFAHGFWSAAFSSASEGYVGDIDGFEGAETARTVATAVLGGTAETLGGGKFANGAATAAFVHLYNYRRHSQPVSSSRTLQYDDGSFFHLFDDSVTLSGPITSAQANLYNAEAVAELTVSLAASPNLPGKVGKAADLLDTARSIYETTSQWAHPGDIRLVTGMETRYVGRNDPNYGYMRSMLKNGFQFNTPSVRAHGERRHFGMTVREIFK